MGKAQRKVHRAVGVCPLMVAAGTLGVGGGGEKCPGRNVSRQIIPLFNVSQK